MKRFQTLMLAIPVAFGLGACNAEDVLGKCEDPDLGAKVEALSVASEALISASAAVKLDLFTACNAIAEDLDETPVTPATAGAPTDAELTEACELASGQIDAAITAGASFELVYVPPRCEVNASAQLSCEANCDVSGECTPGSVDVRCDPGQLSVQCEGSCEAEAYCEADVAFECEGVCEGTCTGTCEGSCSGTAECEGSCEGSCEGTAMCEGTCEGTCSVALDSDGNCMGECDGTCSAAVSCMGTCEGTCTAAVMCEGKCDVSCGGTCQGSCKLDAAASCGAMASCRGGCDGEFTAPKCEGELMPPSCDVDVDCQAGCEGQASFEATCTKPELTVVAEASVSAELSATLTTNLPTVFQAGKKAALMLEAAGDVATATGNVVSAAGAELACIAAFGADAAAQVTASARASVSVSVSIEASASVSGSAAGGTN